jgi:histidinol-phosphatase (PHP family)
MIKKDGHIHTPYCPHGTKDPLSAYVERAMELGFQEISFTEHAPLPKGFVDPSPTEDSAMDMDQLEGYLQEVEAIKREYHKRIKVNAGLEVDFIEGFEVETRNFLNEFGPRLDDSILSVHFLKLDNRYDCLDYSPDVFQGMIERYGSVEALYLNYFSVLKQSILADLGPFKPKRIGHITLIKKFHQKFPANDSYEKEMTEILSLIKEGGYELDYNGAGTAKPLCREPYPPKWVIEKAKTLQIPLVYGSDAHQVKDLNQGREQILL